MRIAFGGAQEKQHNNQDVLLFSEILAHAEVLKFFKFQVGIVSPGTVYCKSIVKMKSPMDL